MYAVAFIRRACACVFFGCRLGSRRALLPDGNVSIDRLVGIRRALPPDGNVPFRCGHVSTIVLVGTYAYNDMRIENFLY